MSDSSFDNYFENGFNQLDDIFNRKPLFDLIMRIIGNSPESGLVIGIDDKWGNGKTSFLKMMISEINNDNNFDINVIYYDAFENDYHSDPFISLSAEVYQSLDSNTDNHIKIKDALVCTAKKVGANLIKGGASFVVSSLTSGILTGSAFEKMTDCVSSSITNPLEEYIEDKIKSGEKDKEDITNFKSVLKNIYSTGGKKTLFIIDELDRARPDFSLDLLEKIKHIFSVDGFVFLLSVNRTQFERIIEKRYGDIDSKTYLSKFVHYWFSLPKINSLSKNSMHGYKESTIKRYIRELNKGVNLVSMGGEIEKTLTYLLEVNSCSLREAERCCSLMFSINNKETINKFCNLSDHTLVALVVFLKVVNPDLLHDIRYRRISNLDACSQLKLDIKDTGAYSIFHVLEYHYATDQELEAARANNLYADIVPPHHDNQRKEIFEVMSDIIEYLHIA